MFLWFYAKQSVSARSSHWMVVITVQSNKTMEPVILESMLIGRSVPLKYFTTATVIITACKHFYCNTGLSVFQAFCSKRPELLNGYLTTWDMAALERLLKLLRSDDGAFVVHKSCWKGFYVLLMGSH